MTNFADMLRAAYELGANAAKNAASWSTDGNSDPSERARVLAMIIAGDGEAFDYLPAQPNLSGEWADAPTPRSLAYEVGYEGIDGEILDAISNAWETGAEEHFETACEAELIRFCEEAR
jgi:hypothetical protein